MTLSISTRIVEGIAVIDLFGELKLGTGTSKVRDAIQDLLRNGYNRVLLNMAEVLHIDSSGIGELMGCYTTVRNQGGELKLLHLSKNVRNLLQVTRLYTIFDVQEDLQQAVKSYK